MSDERKTLNVSALDGWSGPLPDLDAYLALMGKVGAADLFLRADSPPSYRIDGRIVRTEWPAPTAEDMEAYADRILTPVAKRRFAESPDIDAAYPLEGVGRFRINLFLQQGRPGLVARHIPPGNVNFDRLNLPKSILKMADAGAGLILLAGPTGCGKSTTLASMIHHINRTRRAHIVTIEDPIEFVHEEVGCLVHQRQVGYDTDSFASALRHVVRQSPDVILIGEMRDAETIQTAISAALTGHLILSTLHTTSAVQTVERILDHFPPEGRAQVRATLAATLIGVVCMRLLPRASGKGSIPATEILLGSPLARKHIADGELAGLYDVMKRGADQGMCTLTRSLVALAKRGAVDQRVALRSAPNPDEFRLNMDGMFTGVDSIDMRNRKKKEDRP